MHHQHLNLNFGNSGPASAGPSGLRTPPGTQQQQQQQSGGAPAEQAAPGVNTQNPPQAPAPPAPAPAAGNPIAREPNNAEPAQPPAPDAPPLPEARIIEQQAAELTVLRARLAQQEGERNGDPQLGVPAPAQPVLFADPHVVDRARATAIAARDGDKKPSLPDIVPGFKANSLDVREYWFS